MAAIEPTALQRMVAGAVSPDVIPRAVLDLLELAVRKGATDVLLAVDRPPHIRVSGTLVSADEVKVPLPEAVVSLARVLLGERGMAQLEQTRDRDFGFEIVDLSRFRGSFYYHRGGLALALRILPASIPSLESLGLPHVVARLSELPRGLVLVTGPTGSGKSTTLAALIDLVNQNTAKHILTIEDPVEYVHTDKMSRVEQREVGTDTPSFAHALRSVFRQDPDVVLVGEIRDAETIQTALSLAETGHLTFTTLHTNSCSNTIHRLLDVFSEERQAQIRSQLGLSLEAVISQALLPRVGGGLVLAAEVMIGTPAVRTMIREGRAHQLYGTIQAGQQYGMRTLNQSLASLVLRNTVTFEDAAARSPDVKELRQLLQL